MKKLLIIHKIRICSGLVLGFLFLLYFFTKGSFSVFAWYDRSLALIGKILTAVQFIPAFLGSLSGIALSVFVLVSLLLIPRIFGRVYCAVLCPLGLLQDAGFFAGRNFRKRVRRINGSRLLWYGIAVLCVIFCLAGFVNAAGFIDPYSLFGKIAAYALRPAALWMYNMVGAFFEWMGFYIVTPAANTTLLPVLSLAAGFSAVGLLSLAAFRGRLFCNTVCPVGAVLGVLSRFSFYKIKLNSACTSCGTCEDVCRGGCIDIRSFTVDDSRCVRCFDCAAVCPANAVEMLHAKEKSFDSAGDNDSAVSRRTALGISAAAVISFAIPRQLIAGTDFFSFSRFPFPPGAVNRSRFTALCTGCGLCAAKCPTGVIRPAFAEKGLSGFMQPLLDYEKGFCEYGCTVCSTVCPTGALQALLPQKKKTLSIGQTNFEQSRCVVQTDHTACGACAEVCPTHAVTMKPFEDGLTIPAADTSICIGCGACEFQCPVRPARAIFVSGRDVQVDVHQAIVNDDAKPAAKSKEGKRRNRKPEEEFPF